MIATTEALADAIVAAQAAGAVGIDTEFVWERTYYPTLGLVQIGYPDGHCELIDAPRIKDWSPLKQLLEDKDTVKILHDAQQDLMILRRVCGACPHNIFDTQRAAGFVGLSSTISLSGLLKILLKVRLSKSETRSDWLARPLSEQQMKYAEDDVRYSTQLMECILKKADSLGRHSWILEEMRYYENEAIYREFDPDTEMPRVRGSGAMNNQQRNVLRSLGAWREEEARKRNLPRSFILSDDAVIFLIKNPPKSAETIKTGRGLTERVLRNHRAQIWKAIKRGLRGDLPALYFEKPKRQASDEGYESRVDLTLGLIKGICMAAELDPALIGNRVVVTAFVLAAADSMGLESHPILNGWRSEFVGKHLIQFLRGECSAMINSKTNLPELVG